MNKITFVLPNRNNLEFLKLSYKSIRELQYIHEILILDDASTDGTQEWIKLLNDQNLLTYYNTGSNRIGIVGMFDKGIKLSRTDIIFAFHADMIASPNLDLNVIKHLKPKTVVCATRVEPPLHPNGIEKITIALGNEVEDYNYEENKKILYNLENENKNKNTEGIFAPWCMYKKDFLDIGGHDDLFSPQSREDSDLFNRFVLNGYKVVQSWDGLVYHFTSRGSRFNKYAGGNTGINSQEWINTTTKNSKNFIRKWGSLVKHDQFMKPIISHKYDVGFVIKNCNNQLLEFLEPWCDNIYIDYENIIEDYINKEQKNTLFDLRKRVKNINENYSNDIVIEFYGNRFNQESFNIIQNLSDIITESGEIGEFELDIFKIKINKIETYENNLIYLDNEWYNNKLLKKE